MCWQIHLKRKMAAYVHGCLPPDSVAKIEDHLTECDACRKSLARMMEADRLLKQLPEVRSTVDSWQSIERAIGGREVTREIPHSRTHLIAASFALVAILGFALLWAVFQNDGAPAGRTLVFDRDDYQQISLADFRNSAEPHVVTEGYVSSLQVNHEDGDLMFRLVDNLVNPNHFVVCEIIAPLNLKPPAAGSRIRVYGVSRYDGKPDHQWFEVHPVLGIESVGGR